MIDLRAAEAVVSDALSTAKLQNAKSVTKVRVAVGELSGINTHNFASWFNTLTKGSLAENAQLIVDTTPGHIKCICGYEGVPHQVFGEGKKVVIECGKCKSTFVTPLSGRGCEIKEVSLAKA